MSVPAPFRLSGPSLKIGTSGTPGTASTELACHGRRITIVPSQQFEDVETFCNPGGEAPSVDQQSIVMEVLQSFGASGLWNLLAPLKGLEVAFEFNPGGSSAAAAATNPIMEGNLWVPAVPFIDAAPERFSIFSIEFKLSGEPTFQITTGGS